jgi:DNA helicase TIP49 (TBP-interacting protein)
MPQDEEKVFIQITFKGVAETEAGLYRGLIHIGGDEDVCRRTMTFLEKKVGMPEGALMHIASRLKDISTEIAFDEDIDFDNAERATKKFVAASQHVLLDEEHQIEVKKIVKPTEDHGIAEPSQVRPYGLFESHR